MKRWFPERTLVSVGEQFSQISGSSSTETMETSSGIFAPIFPAAMSRALSRFTLDHSIDDVSHSMKTSAAGLVLSSSETTVFFYDYASAGFTSVAWL